MNDLLNRICSIRDMKLIHKGDRFSIYQDGDEAVKIDEKSERRMHFYPQRDASAIAGEIDELTTWQIIRTLATSAHNCCTPISPQHILLDGDDFILNEWSESIDPRFSSPEGYEPVWAIGATIFFLFMGNHVLQGRGGKAQSASTPIPLLRRELPVLSSLIMDCLNFNPQRRPSLSELEKIANENLQRCIENAPDFPRLKESSSYISSGITDIFWPDEMI